MTKIKIAILTFLVGVAATTAYLFYSNNTNQRSHRNAQGLRLEIPDTVLERFIFETLEKRTKKVGIPSLRTGVLPGQDLEVRFWYEGLGDIHGLILRRTNEKWSGTFLRENHHQNLSIEIENLEPPLSGWEAVWTRLVGKGILTLPDQSINQSCIAGVVDGVSYTVETSFNREYRTFTYGNPQYAKCDDAKWMVSIVTFIAAEFDLENHWLSAEDKAAAKAAAVAESYWQALDKTSLKDITAYLAKYPNGRNVYLANAIIRNIKAAKSLEITRKRNSNPGSAKLAAPDATVESSITGEFVEIPSGHFKMGSDWWGTDEGPIHDVLISQNFQMGRYEVTQQQWQLLMGSNPSYFRGDNSLPVENVSWNDVQEFISRLNSRSAKYIYRLPTEAEWEYACRAGSTGYYPGDLSAMAWYKNNSGDEQFDKSTDSFEEMMKYVCRTHPVGLKQPNAWGLYDMQGNVWEWCQDFRWSYSSERVKDPIEDKIGVNRVLRGGSYFYPADDCRSASRNNDAPSNRSDGNGFRLVRTLR